MLAKNQQMDLVEQAILKIKVSIIKKKHKTEVKYVTRLKRSRLK